ncbi:TPR repeat-containing protein ZIP4, partial [Tanacetum coccineum]
CMVTSPLADIEYRSNDGDLDIRHNVFRLDRASYEFVFQHGFKIVAIDMDRQAYEVGLPAKQIVVVEHKIDFIESQALKSPSPLQSRPMSHTSRNERLKLNCFQFFKLCDFETGFTSMSIFEESVALKELRLNTLRFMQCLICRDGEKEENHSSLCVLAMKAWLGLGRYGGTEKDMKETIKDDVKDSVTWPVRIAILILAGDYRYTSSLEVLLALRLQT